MATMHDVAKRANVSISTVSYAINGTRPISIETRTRILTAMEELGYQPHALARGLASKRSRIIALLFPPTERGLGFTELEFVTSAAEAARENGYHLVLWSSKIHDIDELQQLTQQGLADGVVVMEVHMDDARIDLLREIKFPFSIIGRYSDTASIGYTDIDFDQATREAVDYLFRLGHTQIAFINQSQTTYEAGYGPAVRAQAGFEQAMQATGLAGSARLCRAAPAAGYEAFNQLLAENPDLSALITMNERAIPGMLQAVADRDWRIPEDFSLVAIASSERLAEMMSPPLTTFDAPTVELGRLAVELLIQQLEGEVKEVRQVLLPCRLVERGSSGPNRRSG